jgi:2,3-dihydroxy-p-cumate/2,3-dihydroxybenzoate 3,4-dioxygenase
MIRYKKLGYIALNVTDLDRSARFYEDIVDLQPVSRVQGGPAFFRCSDDHHNVALYEGSQAGLKRIGLELEDEDQLEKAFEQLTKAGRDPKEVDAQELHQLGLRQAFRFRDLNGVAFEFYSHMLELRTPYAPKAIKIARLGHVGITLKDQDFDASCKFYRDGLGFKASDYVGQKSVFLRCFPNPFHHSIVVVRGKELRFSHANFMTTDIDDIGRARNRLIKQDVPIVFGPGRHKPSNSIFLYFLDPDGLTVEYSFGMEEFPETGARKPRFIEAGSDSGDMWDGVADPRIATIGRVEVES